MTKLQLLQALGPYPNDAHIVFVEDLDKGIDYLQRDKIIVVCLRQLLREVSNDR